MKQDKRKKDIFLQSCYPFQSDPQNLICLGKNRRFFQGKKLRGQIFGKTGLLLSHKMHLFGIFFALFLTESYGVSYYSIQSEADSEVPKRRKR